MIDLFKILGILMFAKKLPDILKQIFKVDLKGDFKLNPLKKFQDNALGGKLITGTGTAIAAAAIGGATSFRGNTVKERFANAGKGFAAGIAGGYKNPATIKGMMSGRAPYKELRKKEKETYMTAKANLRRYDEQDKLGKKLLEQAFVYDEHGRHVMKTEKRIGRDGREISIPTNEYKTDDSRIFRDPEYIRSFKTVDALKGEKIKASNEADSKHILYSAAVQRYGETSVQAMQARLEWESASKASASASSRYDLAVKKHEELRKMKKHREDAEREDALSFYKKTHYDELHDHSVVSNTTTENHNSGLNINDTTRSENRGPRVVQSQSDASDSEDSDEETILTSTEETVEPNNEYHRQMKQYNESIEQKERQIEQAQAEHDRYINIYGEEARRQEAARDVQRLTVELGELKQEKARFMDAHPEEAIEELEFEIESTLEPTVKRTKTREDEANTVLSSFEGDNYTTTREYQEADKAYDEALKERQDAESRRDEALDKIDELKRKVRNISEANNSSEHAETQAVDEKAKKIAELEAEAQQIENDLSEMSRKYGTLHMMQSSAAKRLKNRLEEIRRELDRLRYE